MTVNVSGFSKWKAIFQIEKVDAREGTEALRGTTLEKKKRHPIIGNNVTIGTGATLLGAITVGDGAKISAGSVVVKSVPSGATVVGVPGKVAGSGNAFNYHDLWA
ncbi:hypothetical protein DRQ12_11285 [candidate division KSB1 bacterium]|nr:MAG: hypothetical protein DRQ12_11285 [candidate division KSB1 bacterium]